MIQAPVAPFWRFTKAVARLIQHPRLDTDSRICDIIKPVIKQPIKGKSH